MEWAEAFCGGVKPEWKDIEDFVSCQYWGELCKFVEGLYTIEPSVEYSKCSGAPGWNVKYKKGGRALCTLYPNSGFFTCLVSIGRKEAMETESLLGSFSSYVRELYERTKPFNGSRWLMIDVTSEKIFRDVMELICIRTHPPKAKLNS